MSLYDYQASQRLAEADVPFYALVMAAMRKADTDNLKMLVRAWPETWNELQARYWAPGGLLPDEMVEDDAERDDRDNPHAHDGCSDCCSDCIGDRP